MLLKLIRFGYIKYLPKRIETNWTVSLIYILGRNISLFNSCKRSFSPTLRCALLRSLQLKCSVMNNHYISTSTTSTPSFHIPNSCSLLSSLEVGKVAKSIRLKLRQLKYLTYIMGCFNKYVYKHNIYNWYYSRRNMIINYLNVLEFLYKPNNK